MFFYYIGNQYFLLHEILNYLVLRDKILKYSLPNHRSNLT